MTTSPWKNARFELVDPRTLLIDQNSRTIEDIEQEDPELCASVKEHGVQIPVIANPTEDGRLRVRDGHSRTIIACQVLDKFPEMPAIITESDDEELWHRLRDQWIANERRRGYNDADKARILEELTLFGLPAEEVAKQLSIPTETVEAGLKVRRSKAATAALKAFPQLSMLQAAELARFEGDVEAYQDLLGALTDDPQRFDHALAQWQQEYRLREEREQLEQQLREAGVTVIDEQLPAGTRELWWLRRNESDKTLLEKDHQAHASCAGHAAYVTDDYHGKVRVVYVCRNWKDHGHIDGSAGNTSSGTTSGLTAEQQKAQRARVIKNNKAWRAAEGVRREKLQELLARKTPPSQAAQFIAQTLVVGEHELRKAMERHHRLACKLLGIAEHQHGKPHPLLATLKKANANQATMISLAVLLAAFEDSTSVETWRSPTAEQKRYFKALADWRVPLHWVECLVNDPAADKGGEERTSGAPAVDATCTSTGTEAPAADCP